MQPTVPWRVLLCDRWSLAEACVSLARSRKKDWRSGLKQHRHLETNSWVRTDAAGQRIPLTGPHLTVEALGPLMPPTASRAGTGGDTTDWPWTLAVRLPGLGTVRRVVTKRGDGHAPRIMALSLPRWPRETLSQDSQPALGVDE